MKPDNQTINDILAGIARATDTHPTRLLARQKVAEFRLDREKGEQAAGIGYEDQWDRCAVAGRERSIEANPAGEFGEEVRDAYRDNS